GTTLHHCRVAEALAGALGPGPADGRVRSVADAAPERPLLVVDAHDPTAWAALRPDVVTPNAAEAEAVLGTRLGTGAARLRALEVHAEALLTRTSATHVVVTLDRDGTVLLGPEGIRHRTWADPATEKQASGAGDTFVAALTLALSTGVPLTAAADLGQAAADVVVHRLGTSLCRAEDLRAHLSGSGSVVRALPALQADLTQARAAGRRIVLTNGCFDGLRHGHTQYLSQAAHLGDVLVVGVNDDAATARLRGPGRPRVPLEERAGLLAALACVDHVVPFPEDTAETLIRALHPDVYVKGGDYTADMVPERAAVEEYGGQVRILDLFADDEEELPGAATAGRGGTYVGP
ncbi:PfkB family carbohydrate kinase, partial [Brevibacterium samyangense]